jgi:hypothetical protein
MKTKNFKKRLTLNKKTIVNLDNGQLAQAKGGATATTCETCSPTCETCVPVPYLTDNCTGDCTDNCTGDCTGHKTCDTYACPISNTCPEICYY